MAGETAFLRPICAAIFDRETSKINAYSRRQTGKLRFVDSPKDYSYTALLKN